MTRTAPARTAGALLLASGLLLAGCGDDSAEISGTAGDGVTFAPASPAGSPTAGASTDAPTAPSGSEPSADLPAFVPADQPSEQAASGERLTVTAVRVARHDGYDRVVLELAGDGQPGWHVAYDDAPAQPGSGEPVEVAGEATLSVLVDGVGYPFDTGHEEYSGPKSLTPSDTEVVRELRVGAVYEGQYDAYVGVTAQRPYRVFRLDAPARLVLDVQH